MSLTSYLASNCRTPDAQDRANTTRMFSKWFAAFLCLFGSSIARADTITFDFVGHVSHVMGALDNGPNPAINDLIAGSFCYDLNSPAIGNSFFQDIQVGFQASVSGMLVYSNKYLVSVLNNYDPDSSNNPFDGLTVKHRDNGDPGTEWLSVGGTDRPWQFAIWLQGPSTIFADGSLPHTLNLADFTQETGGFLQDGTGGGFEFELDSLTLRSTSVPAPTAFVALVGLGLLGFCRRITNGFHLIWKSGRVAMAAKAVLPFLVFSAITASVYADTIYDESVSGDLSASFLNPMSVGTLGIGDNKVLGTFSAVHPSTDFDYFAFTIASGQQLTSVSLKLTDLIGNVSGSGWALYDANESSVFNYLSSTIFLPSPGTYSIFSDALPLAPGNYKVRQGSIGDLGVVGYEFSFQVSEQSQVPGPSSSVALIGLGISGIVARRRRNRKAA